MGLCKLVLTMEGVRYKPLMLVSINPSHNPFPFLKVILTQSSEC